VLRLPMMSMAKPAAVGPRKLAVEKPSARMLKFLELR